MSSSIGLEASRPAPPMQVLWRGLAYVAIAILGYEAIHFWLRDPLHYIVDYSEKSFQIYWPNRLWLLGHIAGGTVALFTGPFQFWSGLKRRSLAIHRMLGLAYVLSIALAGGMAFYLSFSTQPRDFGISLFFLATAWWTTVGMAFLSIKRGNINAHKEWMIRGYVVTLAFVSFRWLADQPLWEPLGPSRFATIGWLCWSVPLLFTEVVLQWRRSTTLRKATT